MEIPYKKGQKVIGWDSKYPDKRRETFFLSHIEGVTPGYVCTAPDVTEEQLDNGNITLRRYEYIEAIEENKFPLFRIGQAVRVMANTKGFEKYGIICLILRVGRGEFHYRIEGDPSVVIAQKDLIELTDEERGGYFCS